MAKNKKFRPGRCIHCLGYYDNLTSDHVFPKSWYPDTTPPDIEKWQAPACADCNGKHGANEQDLLIRFGLCISPTHAAASGIPKKVYKALDASKAKNAKDATMRKLTKDKILKATVRFDSLPEPVIPNFDGGDMQGRDGYLAVLLPEEKLDLLIKKIVRGITYVEDGRFIEDDYSITWGFLKENDPEASLLLEWFAKYTVKTDRGPEVLVERAVPHDDPKSAFIKVTIWGKLKFYVFVLPEEADDILFPGGEGSNTTRNVAERPVFARIRD